MESRLMKKRVERNLSQAQLAIKSNISVRTIQDYEQGKRKLEKAQAGTVKKLAKALNCTMEELLG